MRSSENFGVFCMLDLVVSESNINFTSNALFINIGWYILACSLNIEWHQIGHEQFARQLSLQHLINEKKKTNHNLLHTN